MAGSTRGARSWWWAPVRPCWWRAARCSDTRAVSPRGSRRSVTLLSDELKQSAAYKALELVQDGMLLGLGSGSTARYFTEGVGRLVEEGMKVRGVPTSRETAERLAALAQSLVVRGGEETPYISDNGNLILDVTMEGGIKNPADFGVELKKLTGVVEHGLFIGMADTVIVAGPEGPKAIGRLSGGAVARSSQPPRP